MALFGVMPSGTNEGDDVDEPHAGTPVLTNASTYVPSPCGVVTAAAIFGTPGAVPLTGVTGSTTGLTGKFATAANAFTGGTSTGLNFGSNIATLLVPAAV